MDNLQPIEVINKLSTNCPQVINTAKLSKKRNGTKRIIKYSDALADKICTLVTEGKSISHICSFKAMPSVNTFFSWINEYPELKLKYQQARANKSHLLIERAIDSGDNALQEVRSMDVMDKRCNAIVQAHRLKADTHIKVAGLYNRTEYGDQPAVQVNTAIGIKLSTVDCEQVKTRD
jgi:hypothetical protein